MHLTPWAAAMLPRKGIDGSRQLISSPLSPTRGHESEERRELLMNFLSTVKCLINTFVHAQCAVRCTPCTSVAQQQVVT